MENHNPNRKTTQQYKEAYPDRMWIFDLPRVKDPSGRVTSHKGIVMRCEDPECETPLEEHFVCVGNIVQDFHGDGLYRCRKCAARILSTRMSENGDYLRIYNNGRKTMGPDRISEVNRKSYLTNLKNGTGVHSLESKMKSSSTKDKNNTWFKNRFEDAINDRFDGYKLKWASKVGDIVLPYEIDCYLPQYNLGIEIDDISHKEGVSKPIGYHRKKDDWFLEHLGIKILHLAIGSGTHYHRVEGTWEDLVGRFINGDMSFPLIDLTDPIYGNIVY